MITLWALPSAVISAAMAHIDAKKTAPKGAVLYKRSL
jgi:hypothetical protein